MYPTHDISNIILPRPPITEVIGGIDITGRFLYYILYNIYIYIYICTHFNFLIYGISIEIIYKFIKLLM